jgi:hypothetical protein
MQERRGNSTPWILPEGELETVSLPVDGMLSRYVKCHHFKLSLFAACNPEQAKVLLRVLDEAEDLASHVRAARNEGCMAALY